MDGIKSWIITLMAAAIAGEILLMIAPQGNVSKILKIAVSVFFLGCFLTPFATLGSGGLKDISFDYQGEVGENTSALDQTMQEQTLKEFERNIVQIVTVNLRDIEIPAEKIEVEVNMLEDDSIQIDCIEICLDSSYRPQEKKAADRLHDVFGYKTRLLLHFGEEAS